MSLENNTSLSPSCLRMPIIQGYNILSQNETIHNVDYTSLSLQFCYLPKLFHFQSIKCAHLVRMPLRSAENIDTVFTCRFRPWYLSK